RHRAERHGGRAHVEHGGSPIDAAADERLDVMSAVIGIEQGLPQPPGGKAQETGSDDGNEDVAEGLRQERAQRVLGIDCLVVGPHRRQDRKHPENQEHDPPRRVTDPRYPFKHRSLAHDLAVVAWSPTVSTVMLDGRSDRAPGWTAGHRSLHRGDLYLTPTDAGAPPTAKRPL